MSLSASSFPVVGHGLGRILPLSRRGRAEVQDTGTHNGLVFSVDRSSDDVEAGSNGLTWADTLDLTTLGP